jgi:hypothetical protein
MFLAVIDFLAHPRLTFARLPQRRRASRPAAQRLLLEQAARQGLSTTALRAEAKHWNGKVPEITADTAVTVSDTDADGFPLPPATDEALRVRLSTAVRMLGGLLDKPVKKFLDARAAPERLREVAEFLNRVADAVEGKTINPVGDDAERIATN